MNPFSLVALFEQVRTPRQPSVLAIGAFVAGQALYSRRLIDAGARPSWPVAVLGGLATAAGCVHSRGTKLVPATVIGGAALTATTALAFNTDHRVAAITAGAGEGLRLWANTGTKSTLLDAAATAASAAGQVLFARAR